MPDDFTQNEGLDFTIMPQPATPAGKGQSGLRLFVLTPTMKWIIGGAIVFLVLGGLGFLGYRFLFKGLERPISSSSVPPPEISLPPEEKSTKDSDQDGLTDEEEQSLATNPRKADSDGDGLADGDEKNVYGSDPLLPDTDADSFDDGREVAREYSPIVKVSQKASAQEIKSWSDRIAIYKLHEPTPTTLKIKAATQEAQSKVAYTNSVYKYSFELPAVLTFRETDESRLVGIYISGTNPEGDVLEDPMNVSIAVKVSGQTLNDWTASQYTTSDYEFLQERDINGIKAVRLVGIKNETCPQNKTFFARDNTIIILTWTCNQNSPFAELYEQIVQSFEFIK